MCACILVCLYYSLCIIFVWINIYAHWLCCRNQFDRLNCNWIKNRGLFINALVALRLLMFENFMQLQKWKYNGPLSEPSLFAMKSNWFSGKWQNQQPKHIRILLFDAWNFKRFQITKNRICNRASSYYRNRMHSKYFRV